MHDKLQRLVQATVVMSLRIAADAGFQRRDGLKHGQRIQCSAMSRTLRTLLPYP